MSLGEPPPVGESPSTSNGFEMGEARKPDSGAAPIAAAPVERAISPAILTGLVRLVELVLIFMAGLAVHTILVFPVDGANGSYVAAAILISCAAVTAFQSFGLYELSIFHTGSGQLIRLSLAWTLLFAIVLAISFLTSNQQNGNGAFDSWVVSWFAVGFTALCGWRLALRALVLRWTDAGWLCWRLAILGGGERGEALVHAIGTESHSDLSICGVFDDRNDERSPPLSSGVPKLGTVDDLVEYSRCGRVDFILVSLPLRAEARIVQILCKLQGLPAGIRLAAHMNPLRLHPRTYSRIGDALFLDIVDKPVADWRPMMKSLLDFAVAGLALVILTPIMAIVALAVRLASIYDRVMAPIIGVIKLTLGRWYRTLIAAICRNPN